VTPLWMERGVFVLVWPAKVWREFRHMTQPQLADAAGISVSYLSQLETGKRKASTRVLVAIAKNLQVDVDDLIS